MTKEWTGDLCPNCGSGLLREFWGNTGHRKEKEFRYTCSNQNCSFIEMKEENSLLNFSDDKTDKKENKKNKEKA